MNKPSISFQWRRVTTSILVVGVVAILVALVASFLVQSFRPTIQVKVASGVYHTWMATTEASRVQGLSGVEVLPPGGGLLMDFKEEGKWGIWMRDMEIPLDIVWISKDKTAVYIVKNASPDLGTDKSFYSKSMARYVLELPAGSVDKSAIRVGSRVTFNEADLK